MAKTDYSEHAAPADFTLFEAPKRSYDLYFRSEYEKVPRHDRNYQLHFVPRLSALAPAAMIHPTPRSLDASGLYLPIRRL